MTKDQKRLLEFLLPQYIDGKATPGEERLLFTILNNKDLDEECLAELVEELMAAEPALESYQAEEWQRVLKKIRMTPDEKDTAKAVRLPSFFRWVAAASVVIAIMIGGIQLLAKDKKEQRPNPAVVAVQDVPSPLSTAAVLTLSNGKHILLDSVQQGLFTVDQGIKLIKSPDGQLVYQGAGPEDAPLAYNTISNPRGSQVVAITLSDGTKVWLNSESTIYYPTVFTGWERKVEVRGEAYFEVAHNAAKPFRVTTPKMNVEVLGTHFNINAYTDDPMAATTLLQGSIKVVKEQQSEVLKEGQQAQVRPDESSAVTKKIRVINDVDLKSVVAWKNGLFDFNNAHLIDIMRQLARWYNVEIEYRGTIPQRHYTGAIRKTVNISEVLKMLETAGGIQVTIHNKKIVIQEE